MGSNTYLPTNRTSTRKQIKQKIKALSCCTSLYPFGALIGCIIEKLPNVPLQNFYKCFSELTFMLVAFISNYKKNT